MPWRWKASLISCLKADLNAIDNPDLHRIAHPVLVLERHEEAGDEVSNQAST
jgi:hypothetical protein